MEEFASTISSFGTDILIKLLDILYRQVLKMHFLSLSDFTKTAVYEPPHDDCKSYKNIVFRNQ